MEGFFDDKRVLVACIVGIIIVVTLALIAIVFIWNTNVFNNANAENEIIDTTEITKNSDIGIYKTVSLSQEDIINRYASKIAYVLQYGTISDIYDILDPSYAQYYNLTESDLENKIRGKDIMGKALDMKKYSLTSLTDRKVYTITYSTDNGKNTGTFNVIELSPNRYGIAFDDFKAYYKEEKEIINDGLKVTLYDQVIFNDKYSLKATLKNLNDEEYIINTNGAYENCYIRLNNSNDIRTNTTVLSGNSVTLGKNDELNYNLEFGILNFSYSTAKSIVFKDISSSNNGIVKEYEFDI